MDCFLFSRSQNFTPSFTLMKLKYTYISHFLIFYTAFFYGLNTLAQNNKHPDLVYVEGGVFKMGSTEKDGSPYDKPVHKVKLKSFFICKYEITNTLYAKFLNSYGSDVVKDGMYSGELMVKPHKWGLLKQVDGTWIPQKGY